MWRPLWFSGHRQDDDGGAAGDADRPDRASTSARGQGRDRRGLQPDKIPATTKKNDAAVGGLSRSTEKRAMIQI